MMYLLQSPAIGRNFLDVTAFCRVPRRWRARDFPAESDPVWIPVRPSKLPSISRNTKSEKLSSRWAPDETRTRRKAWPIAFGDMRQHAARSKPFGNTGIGP